jgi:hypothetical protein
MLGRATVQEHHGIADKQRDAAGVQAGTPQHGRWAIVQEYHKAAGLWREHRNIAGR